ncbi:PfaD family polyunsaturated fatty acid/polyketide biosynthesis protein [Candidatus Profftella armatura]|uniref:PfaD family polyunsaturated fatty acid/polyketide biosynthesis protein n=1 Tax=Candidatus Profftella armatura TaxID=669502 RepID=UPI003D9948C8
MIITPENLGSVQFRKDYNVRFSYVAGAMAKGISSVKLVTSMSKSGYLSFYGTGGMSLLEIEEALKKIKSILKNNESYGMNVLANLSNLKHEMDLVNLLLDYDVHNIEASAFVQITPSLVKFRLKGLHVDNNCKIISNNRIIAKVSRPEIALLFLNPAPSEIVNKLLLNNHISQKEADLSQKIPLASDICVEADSAGHTDMGVTSVLLPTIIRLRDKMQEKYNFYNFVRIGSGGGIGTPEAAACAFLLGADFIVTGSINQCAVEAGTSDIVKDMLQDINIQDTAYAPAGDMFELGSKIQVLKRGVLFPMRANKLYDIWRVYSSLDQIPSVMQREIQDRYLKRSFDEVYQETKSYYLKELPEEIEKAEKFPKIKMALIFRWYFIYAMRIALKGEGDKIDYQVHTGPAMGAYNQWIKKTSLENWRNRYVNKISEDLMLACSEYLNKKFQVFFPNH